MNKFLKTSNKRSPSSISRIQLNIIKRHLVSVLFLFLISFPLAINIILLDYHKNIQTLMVASFTIISYVTLTIYFPYYWGCLFLFDFYKLPKGAYCTAVVIQRLFGNISWFFQINQAIIKDAQLEWDGRPTAWLASKFGGPAKLIIYDGSALYLEKNNQFSRIAGPGKPATFLDWNETVKYVVDLRPQTRLDTFQARTKDGIEISIKAMFEYRIGNPESQKNKPKELIYPYDPDAIKRAIEHHSAYRINQVLGVSEFTWIDTAWWESAFIIKRHIGGLLLNEIITSATGNDSFLSSNAIKGIFQVINQATYKFGVFVSDFQIQSITIPEEAHRQLIRYWSADKESRTIILSGQEAANKIRSTETMRAEAQRNLINTIADELGKNGQFIETILLSISKVLDDSLHEPLTRAYLAKETLDTLEQLQQILDAPR
ncbi:MAG: SPFH domain-containing protein [Anaerolineales bacterium]|nr:SPFH domain-containing protein [Anaerolineales bacterium]